jgi:hypothetical protein
MSKARDLANAGTALTTVSATELGYLDGVTSAVQTQINAKEATLPSQTGNSGRYLTTNGTAKSWGVVSGVETNFTAKGQVLVGTGTNTFTAQSVGTDGQVLTANSAQADGVEWTTPATSAGTTAYSVYATRTGTASINIPADRYVVQQVGTAQNFILSNGQTVTGSSTPSILTTTSATTNFKIDSIGQSWTSRTITATGANCIAFGAGVFVIGAWGGAIRTSTDGTTWTSRTNTFGGDVTSVSFVNNRFIAGGQSGALSTSTDGITWTSLSPGITGNVSGIAFGAGVYVITSDTNLIRTSPDLTTWTSRTSGFATGNEIAALTFDNSLFVIVGQSGQLATSTDGLTWTMRTSNETNTLRGVTYGNGLWVAWGRDGWTTTSPNGTTWTARNPGTITSGGNYNVIRYTNNVFILSGQAGGSGTIYYSYDGLTWIQKNVSFSATGGARGSIFGNNTYVSVGFAASGSAGLVSSVTDAAINPVNISLTKYNTVNIV